MTVFPAFLCLKFMFCIDFAAGSDKSPSLENYKKEKNKDVRIHILSKFDCEACSQISPISPENELF